MPFDGDDTIAQAQLIRPYAYHNGAPATADALSATLRNTFFACRYSSRIMGIQTFRTNLFLGELYASEELQVLKDDFVDVAQCKRVLPPWATHVGFVAILRNLSSESAVFTTEIQATDGTHTSTSTALTEAYPDRSDPFELDDMWDPDINRLYIAQGGVALGSVAGDTTTKVKAYALNVTGDREQPFRPEYAVFWWDSIG